MSQTSFLSHSYERSKQHLLLTQPFNSIMVLRTADNATDAIPCSLKYILRRIYDLNEASLRSCKIRGGLGG